MFDKGRGVLGTNCFASKIYVLIITCLISVFFVFSVVYLGVSLGRKAEGFTTSNITGSVVEVAEIWNGTEFDVALLQQLVRMLANNSGASINSLGTKIDNSGGTISAKDLRGYTTGKSNGQTIKVTFGGKDWIVVFLSRANGVDINRDGKGDVIATLWLADSISTTGKFGSGANNLSPDSDSGIPVAMYGTSYMRAGVLNNGGSYVTFSSSTTNPTTASGTATPSDTHEFANFTFSSSPLLEYLVTPKNVSWQEYQSATTWTSLGVNLSNEAWSKSVTDTGFYSAKDNYADKEGSDAWKTDYLWLPSISECGYNDEASPGMWETSQNERSNSKTYMWTRSAAFHRTCAAFFINTNGLNGSDALVGNSYAVRPAIHLNLNSAFAGFLAEVSLDLQGGLGGTTGQITVNYDAPMPAITPPTRTGYTFNGFYSAVNGGGDKYYNANGTSAKNYPESNGPITLYASWTPITYTIAYNGNKPTSASGSVTGSTASSTHAYNTAKNLTANGFSLAGYSFDGWATSSTGAKVYSNSQSVTNIRNTTGTTTLYAKWVPITYTISYNANGGSGTTANSSHTYDAAKVLTTNGFSKTGYSFGGWSIVAGGAKVYDNGQSVTNVRNTAGTTTIYAVWNAITYTIAYNANGGSGTMASSTHTYDTAKNLTANGFSKTGYTFGGWATSAGGTKVYDNSQSVTNVRNTTGTTTLYAVWTPITYTINYNSNKPNYATTLNVMGSTASSTHAYGVAKKLTKNGFILGNFEFLGWATNENGAVAYGDEASVTNLRDTAGVVTLYAVWSQMYKLEINFTPTGGGAVNAFVDNATRTTEQYFKPNTSLTLYATPNTNFAFIGWEVRGGSLTSAQKLLNPLTIAISQDMVLTAIFAEGVLDGVCVTATIGGTAKIVGDNYDDLADNDTITFVADICLDEYAFSHWETLSGKELGTEMSIRLKKSEVMDNVVVAVFVPVGNGNLNSDLNN